MKRFFLLLLLFLATSNVQIVQAQMSAPVGATSTNAEQNKLIKYEYNQGAYTMQRIKERYESDAFSLNFIAKGQMKDPYEYRTLWLVELTNNQSTAVNYSDMLDWDILFYHEDESSIYNQYYYYNAIKITDKAKLEFEFTNSNLQNSLLKPGATAELMFYVSFYDSVPDATRMWLDVKESTEVDAFLVQN